MAARRAVDPAAGVRLLDRVPSGRILHPVRTRRACDTGKLRQGLARGAVCALFRQHDHPVRDDPCRAARPVHARRVRLRALRLPGARAAVRAGARAAHGHARRPDRRELPDDDRAGIARYHRRHRAAVHGERVRHLPAAADFQDGARRA